MQAVVASADGAVVDSVPVPSPGPGQVLVQVKAAGLNRVDLAMSHGGAHGSSGGAGTICGLELAGDVVALGDGVTQWSIGDRVMGSGAAASAELAVAYGAMLSPIPDSISYEQAATLPVGLQTMHNAIATVGGLKTGQSVLIQGATSGMGLIGLQIARELGASPVIGTARTQDRLDQLPDAHDYLLVPTRDESWVQQVAEATGAGADLVIDLVAGPLLNATVQATRIQGRIVNVGRVGGESPSIDLDQHSMRQIQYFGVTFRTRTPQEIADIVAAARTALLPAVAAERITMPIAGVRPIAEARQALQDMADGNGIGKYVLSIG